MTKKGTQQIATFALLNDWVFHTLYLVSLVSNKIKNCTCPTEHCKNSGQSSDFSRTFVNTGEIEPYLDLDPWQIFAKAFIPNSSPLWPAVQHQEQSSTCFPIHSTRRRCSYQSWTHKKKQPSTKRQPKFSREEWRSQKHLDLDLKLCIDKYFQNFAELQKNFNFPPCKISSFQTFIEMNVN